MHASGIHLVKPEPSPLDIERIQEAQIDDFAVQLAIARAYWRSHRKLIEAAFEAIPEPLRSAMEEHEFVPECSAPADYLDPGFAVDLNAWAHRNATALAAEVAKSRKAG